MQSYLQNHCAGAFGPEDVKLLVAAFEDAWTQVPARSTYLDGLSEQTREILAKHIVQAAIAGERDPVRLRDAGLRRLKQYGTPTLNL